MQRFDELPNFWNFLQEIVNAVSAGSEFPFGLTLMLMVMLTIHGMFVLFLTISFHKLVEKYLKPKSIFLAGFFYFIAINLIFVSHFIDLLIWTYTTLYVGAIREPMSAFYFVGEMYTTLGFGQFSVSPQWRILPIIISIGGIFSASISGAALYSMLNTLISKSRSMSVKSGEGF
jgi:phage-related holin